MAKKHKTIFCNYRLCTYYRDVDYIIYFFIPKKKYTIKRKKCPNCNSNAILVKEIKQEKRNHKSSVWNAHPQNLPDQPCINQCITPPPGGFM